MEITIWKLTGQLCLVAVLTFVYNLYQVRMAVRRVKSKHGIVGVPAHVIALSHRKMVPCISILEQDQQREDISHVNLASTPDILFT